MQEKAQKVYYGVVESVVIGTHGGFARIFVHKLGVCVDVAGKNWVDKHTFELGDVVMLSHVRLSANGNWVAYYACSVAPEHGERIYEEALESIGPEEYFDPFEEGLEEPEECEVIVELDDEDSSDYSGNNRLASYWFKQKPYQDN